MIYSALFLFALLSVLFSSVSADVPIPLTSCGTGLITINSATANVWPPVKGQEFSVAIDGDVGKDITGGTYELKLSFDYIPIIDKTGPLTDLNITFPIKAGPIVLAKSVEFPAGIPSGLIDITISAKDQSGNLLVCEQISLTLASKDVKVAAVPIPFTSCAGPTDIGKLVSVTANAWPPVKGSDLTITASGLLAKQVNNGTYEIKASFDGIPLLDQKGLLSDLTHLPLSGNFAVTKTQNLPSFIPSGTIVITITATDDSGEQIICFQVTVNLSAPAPAKKIRDSPVPYTSCGSSSDIAVLESVSANVWPPKKNSDLAITASAKLSKQVTGGSYEIKVKFDGIQILKKTGQLSDLVTLPLSPGQVHFDKSIHLPRSIPGGKIEFECNAHSDDGEEILCFKVEFHLKATAPTFPHVRQQSQFPLIVRPLAIYGNVPVTFTNCGTGKDLLPVVSVSASAWPPVSGQSIEMVTSFDAKQVINDGNYHYVAEYMGIVVDDKTNPLNKAGFQLPIAVGPYSVTQQVNVPSGLPAGTITTTMSATTTKGEPLFCVKISFDV